MPKAKILKRLCLNCEKPISGRSDKKYCNDVCKNEHHNQNTSDFAYIEKRLKKKLKSNRDILKEILGQQNSCVVSKDLLVGKGYEMNYLTHYRDVASKRYYYVFDHGFCEEKNGDLKVVKAFAWRE
ncbi:MAG: hypothetical protein V4539_01015 [Bacteroidota bacterium]